MSLALYSGSSNNFTLSPFDSPQSESSSFKNRSVQTQDFPPSPQPRTLPFSTTPLPSSTPTESLSADLVVSELELKTESASSEGEYKTCSDSESSSDKHSEKESTAQALLLLELADASGPSYQPPLAAMSAPEFPPEWHLHQNSVYMAHDAARRPPVQTLAPLPGGPPSLSAVSYPMQLCVMPSNQTMMPMNLMDSVYPSSLYRPVPYRPMTMESIPHSLVVPMQRQPEPNPNGAHPLYPLNSNSGHPNPSSAGIPQHIPHHIPALQAVSPHALTPVLFNPALSPQMFQQAPSPHTQMHHAALNRNPPHSSQIPMSLHPQLTPHPQVHQQQHPRQDPPPASKPTKSLSVRDSAVVSESISSSVNVGRDQVSRLHVTSSKSNSAPTTASRLSNPWQRNILTSPNRDNVLKKRVRINISDEQLQILLDYYKTDPCPPLEARQRLSQQIGMTPRRIQVWFQNRRAKLKKERQGSRRSDDEDDDDIDQAMSDADQS